MRQGGDWRLKLDERTKAVLTIINRLLASFPGTASGSSDDALDGYLLGTAEIPPEFLAIAAQRFLAGSVAGQHMSFPPSPAQFATEARQHWYAAIEREREEQLRLNPPRREHIPAEERARVKAGFDDLAASLGATMRTEDATADARRKSIFQRTNERFYPSMDEQAMKRRLGYSVGDADGEADAA